MAASASSTSSRFASALPSLLVRTDVRWAVGGWALFIAENALLSENRTVLIEYLGDETYHALYGLCSTIATGSIAYSYYYLTKKLPASLSKTSLQAPPPLTLSPARLAAAWSALSVGLCLASQAVPQLQIPVNSQLQVRCPFDFAADRRRSEGSDDDSAPRGLERITRHPGLWSLALAAAGPALLAPSPLSYWWWGPTAVAALGGWHTDARFRRGMGGTLDPTYDSQTSNVPFVAMLAGKQGRIDHALSSLLADLKPLNAGIAVAMATACIVSRGRVR